LVPSSHETGTASTPVGLGLLPQAGGPGSFGRQIPFKVAERRKYALKLYHRTHSIFHWLFFGRSLNSANNNDDWADPFDAPCRKTRRCIEHLSPAGLQRAGRLASYIPQTFGKPDFLFAAADSEQSHRPVETIEPLSQATGVPIDSTVATARFGPAGGAAKFGHLAC
jgi:hypothetical protein